MVLAGLLLPTLALGARPISNFPIELGQRIDSAPALVDVNGDGRSELLVSAGSELHLIDAQGRSRPGFPLTAKADLTGAPAMFFGGGGRALLLVLSAAGTVHLVDGNGVSVEGFPLRGIGRPSGGGALFDLDGDGLPEAVFATREGKLHAHITHGKKAGKALAGFPVRFSTELTSPPTLADLGGVEARRVILVGGSDGIVHAADARGKILANFKPRSRYKVSAAAVGGDLEGDGRAEVVFGSGDFKLYVVESSGKIRRGFPAATGYRIRAAPALADLDGDGKLEIAFTSGDNKVHVVNARGRPHPGFPVTAPGKLEGGVVIGDLAGDERPELATVTQGGELFVLQADGKRLPGWEASLGAKVTATPALGDLDGNGQLEIAVGTMTGRVTLFTGRGARKGRALWATEAHGPARSGWLHPTPSRFVKLSIEPTGPTTLEALKISYGHIDLDRRKLEEVELTWLKDGKIVEAMKGRRELPPSATGKGESWSFRVRNPADGSRAIEFESPAVEIRNTPPTAPGILLEPKSPRSGQPISIRIVEAAGDVDGEEVSYEQAWWRNGERVDLPSTATEVPGELVQKQDEWTVEVRAIDSQTRSTPARASVRVVNTIPPSAPITIAPAKPGVTDVITARAKVSAADADGDRLHPHYAWSIDGVPADRPAETPTLPAGLARKHQVVEVSLTLDDGESSGPATQARIEVVNTPPAAPEVIIAPARPHTGQSLRAKVTRAPVDPDLDPIRSSYAWSLDGAPTDLTGPEVPGDRVKAGQQWGVTVTPSDDESSGAPGTASVEVLQSPPRPPVIAIQPLLPVQGQSLKGVVREEATDRDGDPIQLRWRWTLRGKNRGSGQSLPGTETRRGQTWTLVVTPFDGKAEGRSTRASVTIGNRPPNEPIVNISPARPKGGETLRAEVTLVGDPDEDEVRPRLQWWLDGKHLSDLEDRSKVPGDRVKHFQVWELILRADDGDLLSKAVRATAPVSDRPPMVLPTKVGPVGPPTTSDLRCEAVRKPGDPDGDAVSVRFHWYRAGQETSWEGVTLPAAATRKQERWSCQSVTSALELKTRSKLSKFVQIVNSAPNPGTITIEPTDPRTQDDLHCVVQKPFTDADRDLLDHRTLWSRKGRLEKRKGSTLPSAHTRRGEKWTCEVSASDGKSRSAVVKASVTVGNSAPTAPMVRLLPTEPTPHLPLRCEIVDRGRDPDGDTLSFRFRWYLEDKVQPFASTSVAVPVRALKAGQTWWCGVTGFDGKTEGEEGRSARRRIREALESGSSRER